jgi:hypothetical protein
MIFGKLKLRKLNETALCYYMLNYFHSKQSSKLGLHAGDPLSILSILSNKHVSKLSMFSPSAKKKTFKNLIKQAKKQVIS